jgi:DNA-binding transcriptional LysR family regulator
MPDMDWDDVRVFLEVARAGALAAGARAAAVDRSTASRRIARLERALGARLFLRSGDGLRLSPTGERLVAHGERMAEGAAALATSARHEGGEVSGLVRVATTEALAALLVRDGLLDLRKRYPKLELEVLGGNRSVDLAHGEADLALRVTPIREASIRVRRVVKLTFACFAHEGYVKRRGHPRSAREMAGHEVLVPSGELGALPEAKWLHALPATRIALRTNSMPALLSALWAEQGITVLAGVWAAREAGPAAPRASGTRLVQLFAVDAIPPRPLFLAMHPDAAARTAVRAVADAVVEIVQRPT